MRSSTAILLGTALLAGCGSEPGPLRAPPTPMGAPRASAAPLAPAGSSAAESSTAPDYLILSPAGFYPSLRPLVELREQQGHVVELLDVDEAYDRFAGGNREPLALLRAVRAAWQRSEGKARFLLIVGDPPEDDEPSALRVPTFYLPKMDYSGDDDGRRFPRRVPLSLTRRDPRTYPSDHPFALVGSRGASALEERPALAVGRVPARTESEVSDFVAKVIDHERAAPSGAAARRLVVMAGQARFGKMLDTLIEGVAMRVLDEQVPSQFELDVVFAKPGSPYAYRFDRLADKLVTDAEAGALLLLYVGHSAAQHFDGVEYRGSYYPIGTRADFARMAIRGARPLFLSLSCDAGEFDLDGGARSMAEEAVLNPGGPIAAFAASRESHPYPNLLYGEAFVAHFLQERPATIGEALIGARIDVEERSSMLGELLAGIDTEELRTEHASLYNLLGDPATRLRYGLPASVELEPVAPAGLSPASPLAVQVRSELTEGVAEIRLETRRTVLPPAKRPAAAVDALPLDRAFTHMAESYARAIDKVVARTTVEVRDGGARAELVAPSAPGRYVVKVLVTGTHRGEPATAIGAASLTVAGRAPR